jgi:hypothetical protein
VIRLHDIYGYPDPYIFLHRGLKERPRHANIRHHEMPTYEDEELGFKHIQNTYELRSG